MSFLSDVLEGLQSTPKTLPCKYFYDERGAELFEQICELEEYYLTRADLAITRDNIDAICACIGSGVRLIELGSGAGMKTRIVLDHLREPVAYVPVDISATQLEKNAAELRKAYPDIEILPVATDYTQPIPVPDTSREPKLTVFYFPGSTIGNFEPPDAIEFLKRLGAVGSVLIGVDLKKDKHKLERAYDDAKGITAAFNLNILVHINRELGGDFDLARFAHRSRYDEELGRIEMYLDSLEAQTVHVGDHSVQFGAGEATLTEVSYKYSLDDFAQVAAEAGLRVTRVWTDDPPQFSLQLLA